MSPDRVIDGSANSAKMGPTAARRSRRTHRRSWDAVRVPLGDFVFVLEMLLAPVLLVAAVVGIATEPSGRSKNLRSWVACLLGSALVVSAASTFWWWGVGFDEAERLGVPTRGTDRTMIASAGVAAAAYLGFVFTGVASGIAQIRQPRR